MEMRYELNFIEKDSIFFIPIDYFVYTYGKIFRVSAFVPSILLFF